MSVVINGMEMPINCTHCPCSDDESRFCRAANEYIPMLGKPKFCPITEQPKAESRSVYRRLIEQGRQRWIPCSKRLPGAAHVLATLRWDEEDYEVTEIDYHAIVAAQDDEDYLISDRAKGIIEHVIAWMPLPEPWRVEKEK